MKPRKPSWKPQPHGSRLCGQTCVAMLAKVSLKRSIKAFDGRMRGTRAKHVLAALARLGVEIKGKRLIPVTGGRMPQRCLQCVAFVHYRGAGEGRKTFRHWRILWDGHIYDPVWGISFLNGSKPSEAWWERVTSYIEL